ncbi:MAG: putative ABC transporter permease [Bacilli bacterium]|nr:putative ABC transporter permease [Bacilli bacterium]
MITFIYHIAITCALFFIYSFIGWLFEVLQAIIKNHKFINRGFLIGPIVPIWGAGAILISLCLKQTDNIFYIIILSILIGSILEYIVNYLMEKIFKARWWDYSNLPFNLNGRICLASSCTFGIGGLLVIKILNPLFINLIKSINKIFLIIIITILLVIIITDFVISCNIIQKLKLSAETIRKDYTEEISKKVKNILMEKSLWFKRLLKAFPNISLYKK